MLGKLKEYFRGTSTLEVNAANAPTDSELQIAVGLLLLQMAGQDDDYAPEEVKTVYRVMQQQFGLSDEETLELLEVADVVRQDKSKVDGYFKAISENYTSDQKKLIFTMLWQVVLADGKVEKFEERFATQVKFRLQLSDAQVEEAKKMAASGQI